MGGERRVVMEKGEEGEERRGEKEEKMESGK